MKLKDKILKDFREKFLISGDFLIRAYPYDVKEFLFKALDSMREETLREVEKEAIIDGKITNKKAVSAINRVMIYLINNLKTKNEKTK